ncbi:thiamine pyrophosphate-binding protein [Neptunomonas sp. XY-337]|uniref:thiamine pyrophosphate-binding protein n=1 Tax=Neptunomonas sp. XY-337 TaxID=2561897 RepID=UPI0010A9D93A|nr:thiamine pyrophosphate-binding protein [Neptunomonas sp. XY-337]
MSDSFTFADVVIDFLRQLNIDRVFGVPGGSIEPFFNAVLRAQKRGEMQIVVSRHESGAAFMADGYARERGHFGVCCATTGPGITNLMTGVASAFVDRVPMLVITAQTPLAKFAKQSLQDSSRNGVDVVSMMGNCTKFTTLVSHPSQLVSKLIQAINTAQTLPRGPVHISIPSDILAQTCEHIPTLSVSNVLERSFSRVDLAGVAQLQSELKRAQRVAILVGADYDGEGAWLESLAERLNAAVLCAPAAKGQVNECSSQFVGVYGFAGHTSARAFIQGGHYDLLLCFGTRFCELSTNAWSPHLLNDKVVHIDANSGNFVQSPMARLHLLADYEALMPLLVEHVDELRADGYRWLGPRQEQAAQVNPYSKAVQHVPVLPQALFSWLANRLPKEARVHVDAGNAWAWATHYFRRAEVSNRYRIAMGFGSMTWGIGSAIGSAFANPNVPHVCITGDGSYLMAGQEITVAQQYQLPLLMIILNDSVLGMVMHGQRMGGAERGGFELPRVNYAALAEAMGVRAMRVSSVIALQALDIEALLSKEGPTVLDVQIDSSAMPPMGERVKGLTAVE